MILQQLRNGRNSLPLHVYVYVRETPSSQCFYENLSCVYYKFTAV